MTEEMNGVAPVPMHKAYRPQVMGLNGMVTSGHYLASWWGCQVLSSGGNAVDAGVAAGLVLNVVHNDMASFTGVAPIVLYEAESGKTWAIAGIGRWPEAASIGYFERNHDGKLPQGVLRSVVPAAADAWITALREFGTMSFAEVASYPIKLAKEGYPVHNFQAYYLREYLLDDYRSWPTNAEIYLSDGDPPEVGDVLIQRALGQTLETIAQEEQRFAAESREKGLTAARDLIYKGAIAKQLVAYYRDQGALISESDFSKFEVTVEDPITIRYKDYQVVGCGPWSQGPVLLMALGILEQFDLQALGHNTAEYVHVLTEAIKLAFSDLEAFCGDPEFVEVPMRALLSKEYLRERAELIDQDRAFPRVPPHGDPERGLAVGGELPEARASSEEQRQMGDGDTSFCCAIDGQGNVFSATPSDGYEGNPIVPELGLHISTRGCQSRLDREHPNALAPRKRPRLTPNPALVLKEGQPVMAIGTPGNNRQPQAMLQVFLNIVEFGMDPQQAVEAPRFASFSFPGTQYPFVYEPGLLRIEATFPQSVQAKLEELGHKIEVWPAWHWNAGGVNVIYRTPQSGLLAGGADPRRETYTVTW